MRWLRLILFIHLAFFKTSSIIDEEKDLLVGTRTGYGKYLYAHSFIVMARLSVFFYKSYLTALFVLFICLSPFHYFLRRRVEELCCGKAMTVDVVSTTSCVLSCTINLDFFSLFQLCSFLFLNLSSSTYSSDSAYNIQYPISLPPMKSITFLLFLAIAVLSQATEELTSETYDAFIKSGE